MPSVLSKCVSPSPAPPWPSVRAPERLPGHPRGSHAACQKGQMEAKRLAEDACGDGCKLQPTGPSCKASRGGWCRWEGTVAQLDPAFPCLVICPEVAPAAAQKHLCRRNSQKQRLHVQCMGTISGVLSRGGGGGRR